MDAIAITMPLPFALVFFDGTRWSSATHRTGPPRLGGVMPHLDPRIVTTTYVIGNKTHKVHMFPAGTYEFEPGPNPYRGTRLDDEGGVIGDWLFLLGTHYGAGESWVRRQGLS